MTFDLYPRPIPTPVHNLRPARETCEQCHWPSKFVGRPAARSSPATPTTRPTRAEQDRAADARSAGQQAGAAHGIHWHVDPERRDPLPARREAPRQIHEVEMTRRRRHGRRRFKPDRGRRPKPPGRRRGARWTASTATTGRPTSTASRATRARRRAPRPAAIDRDAAVRAARGGCEALQADYPTPTRPRARASRRRSPGFYAASYPDARGRDRRTHRAAGRGARRHLRGATSSPR